MAPTKRLQYNEESMEAACSSFKKGMSVRESARIHGVPYATLRGRLRGRTPMRKQQRTVLRPTQENKLIEWLSESTRRGFCRNKEQLRTAVQHFLNDNKIETIFKDNRPGDKWLRLFKSRHKDKLSIGVLTMPLTDPSQTYLTAPSVVPSQTDLTAPAVVPSQADLITPSTIQVKTDLTVSHTFSSQTETSETGQTLQNSQDPTSNMTAQTALDRLLHLSARAGSERLEHYMTCFDLQIVTDELEQQLFSKLYRRLLNTFNNDCDDDNIDKQLMTNTCTATTQTIEFDNLPLPDFPLVGPAKKEQF